MGRETMYGADWCVMTRKYRKSLGFRYQVILQGKSNRRLTKGGAAGVVTICVEGLCVCGRGSEMSTGRECVSLRYALYLPWWAWLDQMHVRYGGRWSGVRTCM